MSKKTIDLVKMTTIAEIMEVVKEPGTYLVPLAIPYEHDPKNAVMLQELDVVASGISGENNALLCKNADGLFIDFYWDNDVHAFRQLNEDGEDLANFWSHIEGVEPDLYDGKATNFRTFLSIPEPVVEEPVETAEPTEEEVSTEETPVEETEESVEESTESPTKKIEETPTKEPAEPIETKE